MAHSFLLANHRPATSEICYPPISTVPEGIQRPLWSVMIPTYNGLEYLEQTLRSVLEQNIGPDQMQIEVVDDYSTQDDPEPLVREVGQGRVSFFRNPQNLGLIDNWNACIQRAYGQWVHILHQDDFVLPGFYDRLQIGIQQAPTSGAAFCRHRYVDEHDNQLFLSLEERETAGILNSWFQLIATMQRVQFPAIVVQRSTFETLGGFCPQARSAADWEMWQRIAAHHPIWYEPQILACFRLHTASESSRLIRTGTNISDTRRAIAISRSYSPAHNAHELTQKALEYYAIDAFSRAYKMLERNDSVAALAQIREGLKCSFNLRTVHELAAFCKHSVKYWLRQTFLSKFTSKKLYSG